MKKILLILSALGSSEIFSFTIKNILDQWKDSKLKISEIQNTFEAADLENEQKNLEIAKEEEKINQFQTQLQEFYQSNPEVFEDGVSYLETVYPDDLKCWDNFPIIKADLLSQLNTRLALLRIIMGSHPLSKNFDVDFCFLNIDFLDNEIIE